MRFEKIEKTKIYGGTKKNIGNSFGDWDWIGYGVEDRHLTF